MVKLKIHKFNLECENDCIILGVSSGFADYRLAWEINRALNINLLLGEQTLDVFDKKNNSVVPFRTHSCFIEETMTSFILIKNKQNNTFLVVDKPQIDYYLFLKDLYEYELNDIIQKLRNINGMSAVFDLSDDYIEAIEYLNFN